MAPRLAAPPAGCRQPDPIMSAPLQRLVTHPALALAATLLGGLQEWLALLRLRWTQRRA